MSNLNSREEVVDLVKRLCQSGILSAEAPLVKSFLDGSREEITAEDYETLDENCGLWKSYVICNKG